MLGLLKDRFILIFLAFVGGFIDTATFVGADGVFSAHVTGNFVVFASQFFSKNDSAGAYLNLLTFPCFALGVLFVGTLHSWKKIDLNKSLSIMGILILLSGFSAIALPQNNINFLLTLILVIAMGIQNAAHKVFLKGTPTSTVMTGNTAQFFLDLVSPVKSSIFTSTIEMIISFFIGCASGAFLAYQFGLAAVIVPGILTLVTSFMCRDVK